MTFALLYRLPAFQHRYPLSYTEFAFPISRSCIPYRDFIVSHLTSAFLYQLPPFQHRYPLSYTEFTFCHIEILNPIPRFSRIVLDLRFTISDIPFPTSISLFLYRVYLSLYRDTVSQPYRDFLVSYLSSALVYRVSPFQRRCPLSYTESTFRYIEILYSIPRFPRIVFDPRFTISGIPFQTSISPFLYRVYLSLCRYTGSHTVSYLISALFYRLSPFYRRFLP